LGLEQRRKEKTRPWDVDGLIDGDWTSGVSRRYEPFEVRRVLHYAARLDAFTGIEVTDPKGGRVRYVGLTDRLAAELKTYRHLRGPRVLYRVDGSAMTQKAIPYLAGGASRRAGVNKHGVHILRHTFCSRLAMSNAPMKAIQELAGHADLSTTMRYMHLSPASRDGAIKLLERGDSGETETLATASS
jgi:integrase